MKLPNCENAKVAREKIVDYLLSLVHVDGHPKAKFFLAFGFEPDRWEEMADALKLHARDHEVSKTVLSEFGVKYIIEGAIWAPDGREPYIRSVWTIPKDDDVPYLVTAYPLWRSQR